MIDILERIETNTTTVKVCKIKKISHVFPYVGKKEGVAYIPTQTDITFFCYHTNYTEVEISLNNSTFFLIPSETFPINRIIKENHNNLSNLRIDCVCEEKLDNFYQYLFLGLLKLLTPLTPEKLKENIIKYKFEDFFGLLFSSFYESIYVSFPSLDMLYRV